MLELGMVSSFHPHSMCKRVQRVTAKTGRTSCTNWTISFGVSGFRTRTHLLHWHFFFKVITTPDFFAFRTHHSKRRHQFSKLSDIICYFLVTYQLFRDLNDREIENHYKMNSENVGTWHGLIISPTQHVQKSREGHGKNWMHFVYKMDNLFRSIRVSDKNSSVTKAFHFLNNLFELLTFCVFKMHHSKPHHQFTTLFDFICYFSCIY